MEVLEKAINVTIEDILKMGTYFEAIFYGIGELEMFQALHSLDTYKMNIKTTGNLKGLEVVRDSIRGNTEIIILQYEGKPFALLQYRGRGICQNELIFDKEVHTKFIKDYMNEYIEHVGRDDYQSDNMNDKELHIKYLKEYMNEYLEQTAGGVVVDLQYKVQLRIVTKGLTTSRTTV